MSRSVIFASTLIALACSQSLFSDDTPRAGEDRAARNIQCDIVLDHIPNPLTVRLENRGQTTWELSEFMAKHATMPPMPNVRIEARNRRTGKITAYVPVVLSEQRKQRILRPGQTTSLSIYHRGLKLPPGEYDITVLFFVDEDVPQEKPIGASDPLGVQVRPHRQTGTLSELTGVFRIAAKDVERYHIVLDGTDQKCCLRGEVLRDLEDQSRIRVKGTFKSYLFKHTLGPEVAPPPFHKGWVIYLDVQELEIIERPFGE